MSMDNNVKLIYLSPSDTCACIAMDVVNSEKYKDKEKIRLRLIKICNILNKKHESVLVVPFQVRKGDEIVGVVSSFSRGFFIYKQTRVLAQKYNIELYFGLGLGSLDTGPITDINEINGSAVINAWRAIDNHLKNKEFLKDFVYQKYPQGVSFFCLGKNDIPYRAINALVYTIYNELNGTTTKQRSLIQEFDIEPKLTLEEIGKKMGYDQNARENASKLLSRAGYDKYIQMQKDVSNLLKIIQSNLGGNEA